MQRKDPNYRQHQFQAPDLAAQQRVAEQIATAAREMQFTGSPIVLPSARPIVIPQYVPPSSSAPVNPPTSSTSNATGQPQSTTLAVGAAAPATEGLAASSSDIPGRGGNRFGLSLGGFSRATFFPYLATSEENPGSSSKLPATPAAP